MKNTTAQLPGIPEFAEAMRVNGWFTFADYLDPAIALRLGGDLDTAYEASCAMKRSKGLEAAIDGTVHHLVLFRGLFLDFLKIDPLHEYIRHYFSGQYILSCYNAVINKKSDSSYVANIHRDTRFYCRDLTFVLNMLVMLDDFTIENGATHVLPGSHLEQARPTDEVFFAKSQRLVGRRGSVVLFDSNLWHAAGRSMTSTPRRCLTLTYSRPSLKQQFDYPRALGYELAEELPENLRQVLGYNSRVPASLDEWFQPAERRFYRAGQDRMS